MFDLLIAERLKKEASAATSEPRMNIHSPVQIAAIWAGFAGATRRHDLELRHKKSSK